MDVVELMRTRSGTQRIARECAANEPFDPEKPPHPRTHQGARDRADAERSEKKAVGQRASMHEIARYQRHQGGHGDRRETEGEAAQEDGPDRGRHRHISNSGAHRVAQRFRWESAWGTDRSPAEQDRDQRQIADGVDRECRGGSRRCDDRATDGRSETSGDIEPHAVERNRRREIGTRHHLADGGLPGRTVQCRAATDQEGECQQRKGRDEVEIRRCSQPDRDHEQEKLGRQHDFAPVVIIGDRTGCEREHHDGQRRGGLHQSDHIGRIGDRRHHPGRADGLYQTAEIRSQTGKPHGTKNIVLQRRERRCAETGAIPIANNGFIGSRKNGRVVRHGWANDSLGRGVDERGSISRGAVEPIIPNSPPASTARGCRTLD